MASVRYNEKDNLSHSQANSLTKVEKYIFCVQRGIKMSVRVASSMSFCLEKVGQLHGRTDGQGIGTKCPFKNAESLCCSARRLLLKKVDCY